MGTTGKRDAFCPGFVSLAQSGELSYRPPHFCRPPARPVLGRRGWGRPVGAHRCALPSWLRAAPPVRPEAASHLWQSGRSHMPTCRLYVPCIRALPSSIRPGGGCWLHALCTAQPCMRSSGYGGHGVGLPGSERPDPHVRRAASFVRLRDGLRDQAGGKPPPGAVHFLTALP